MTKIALLGQRTCCTPFFHTEYRSSFQQHYNLVDRPEHADIIICSLAIEVRDNIGKIRECITHNPDLKLVVISEEPLWDTIWGGDFTLKEGLLHIGGKDYPYTVLNHFTTKIFDFEKIPYFLTTNDDFSLKYSTLFGRNCSYRSAELLALWKNAQKRAVFYAERREEAIHDFRFSDLDLFGLSRYRTLIASGLQGNGIVKVGHGWGSTVHRHKIPDWHQDKLTDLDQQAFLISGIENTHQWNYVTEKIFDAFAVLGVPLYFASPSHSVMRLVPPESFINLYGLSVGAAIEKIRSFKPDLAFAERYLEAQSRLFEIFSDPANLVRERERVVSEITSELNLL